MQKKMEGSSSGGCEIEVATMSNGNGNVTGNFGLDRGGKASDSFAAVELVARKDQRVTWGKPPECDQLPIQRTKTC